MSAATLQKEIRVEVYAALAPLVSAGQLFHALRRDVDESECPCINVFSMGDMSMEADAALNIPHVRGYKLRIEIRVAGRPEEDVTDALADGVRDALNTSITLRALCEEILWGDQLWDGVEVDRPLAGTALDVTFTYLFKP